MPSDVDAADALRRAQEFGPFFAVELDPETAPGSQVWQPISDLLAPDGQLRASEVEQTRSSLGALAQVEPAGIEPRVAASLWLLGWAARLFAPALGAALHGVVPTVSADQVRWQPSPGQPRPLAIASPRGRPCTPGDAEGTATQLYAACLTPLVEPLVTALATDYALSLQVLWGNVASAVAGTADTADTAHRPSDTAARPARDIAAALLRIGALRGRGSWRRTRGYRRTSCCLLYRVAGSGICSDCVLGAP